MLSLPILWSGFWTGGHVEVVRRMRGRNMSRAGHVPESGTTDSNVEISDARGWYAGWQRTIGRLGF